MASWYALEDLLYGDGLPYETFLTGQARHYAFQGEKNAFLGKVGCRSCAGYFGACHPVDEHNYVQHEKFKKEMELATANPAMYDSSGKYDTTVFLAKLCALRVNQSPDGNPTFINEQLPYPATDAPPRTVPQDTAVTQHVSEVADEE